MDKLVNKLGFKGVVILTILFFVLLIAFQNLETTQIRILFWKVVELPKLYLLLGTFFFGFVTGFLFCLKGKNHPDGMTRP